MTDAINALIGERVRFYRTTRKITQEQMAASFTVPICAQQLAKYEVGKSRWPADLLIEIAKELRLDIRLLTGMEDGKHEGKDDSEWEAERYKNIILALDEKARKIIYRIIDGIKNL